MLIKLRKKQKQGFTLIELLVVIAIISVLAALIISSVRNARLRAEDARMIQLVSQLRTAFEFYYLDNNEYPPSTGVDTGFSSVCGTGEASGLSWLTPTLDEDLIASLTEYYPGIQVSSPCTRLFYFAGGDLNSTYQDFCKLDEPFEEQQGYLLVYDLNERSSRQDEYWYFTSNTPEYTDHWHCRTHIR